jgi:hypothetical protein
VPEAAGGLALRIRVCDAQVHVLAAERSRRASQPPLQQSTDRRRQGSAAAEGVRSSPCGQPGRCGSARPNVPGVGAL